MKGSVWATLILMLAHAAACAASGYGPNGCVAISRSARGTCVISTNCADEDISKLNFAFDCLQQDGTWARHTYGQGGFEDEADADTDVACKSCLAPGVATQGTLTPVGRPLSTRTPVVQAIASRSHAVASKYSVTTNSSSSANVSGSNSASNSSGMSWNDIWSLQNTSAVPVSFGPNRCVMVYKSAEGHCVMKTECTAEDIANYNFGFVCAKDGVPTRHVFGVGSFGPEETFDTLIHCNECLGDQIPDDLLMSGQIEAIGTKVFDLAYKVGNMSEKLNVLFPASPSPSPAPFPAPAPANAAPVQFTAQHHRSHSHHTALRGARRHHHVQRHLDMAQHMRTKRHVKQPASAMRARLNEKVLQDGHPAQGALVEHGIEQEGDDNDSENDVEVADGSQ